MSFYRKSSLLVPDITKRFFWFFSSCAFVPSMILILTFYVKICGHLHISSFLICDNVIKQNKLNDEFYE